MADGAGPRLNPAHGQVSIPANAAAYFLQEMGEVPTQVMYEHGGECWWNLAFFHDALSQQLSQSSQNQKIETMHKFVGNIAELLSEGQVQQHLGPCLYVKPSNGEGGSGLMSKTLLVLTMNQSTLLQVSARKQTQTQL